MSLVDASPALDALLAEAGFWAKESSEGANSLLRAVSAGLYFTERYQEVLRELVASFFRQRCLPRLKSESQLRAAERFLAGQSLPEFEALTLEIVGRLFEVNPTLHFAESGRLLSRSHGPGVLPPLSLVRLGEGSYAALFPLALLPAFVFSQNLVLNVVESALGATRRTPQNLNGGTLINFDFRRWLSQSRPPAAKPAPRPVDFRWSRLSAGPPTAKPSRATTKEPPNVGSELISLLHRRKNSGRGRPDLPPPSLSNRFAFLQPSLQPRGHRKSRSLRPSSRQSPSCFEAHELARVDDSDVPAAPLDTSDSADRNGLDSSLGDLLVGDPQADPLRAIEAKFGSAAGGAEVEGEAKPRPGKVSLKEKLMKKLGGPDGRLDLSKTLTFAEAGREREPGRLLSELKGFGKEKYQETVDGRVFTGNLKFFDDKNGFGFFQIVRDDVCEDVFVYKSEFDKADIRVDTLKSLKGVYGHTFSFQIATYVVHHDRRKKAINIKLL